MINWQLNFMSSNSFFDFRQNISGKCVSLYSKQKNTPFQIIKSRKKKKKSKNCDFPKVGSAWFSTKIGQLSIFFQARQDRTNTHKPLWKNASFWTFLTPRFYSLERLYFYLEYRQTFFSCLLFLKEKERKLLIVGPKLCNNPLKIILTFLLYSYVVVDSS